MKSLSAIETLESRIAPAVTIVNSLFDITAGIGKTGAVIDLGAMVDGTASYRSVVEFTTNYILPGTDTPAKIVLELFDDKAPLSVQNFLGYVNGKTGSNYDGTFFHRTADFGDTSEAGIDIIQAGGFNISDIFQHILTGPTVHNEYDGSDPELLNTRGTLAMAKTDRSEHTGTSEWFINLHDNSTILGGTNNGGYTVFGVVREGLDLIDAIGAASRTNLGGSLTELPVQNGYIAGTPTSDQLIQIVDARVVEAGPANASGHTFSVISVNQHGLSTPSSLLTATTEGTQLKLAYKPGATGVADITVEVKNGNDVETDTFSVTIQPNLITEITSHNLPSTYVSGDKGVAKVKLTNNTGGTAKGQVEVRLYLSEVISLGGGRFDQRTFTVDAEDQLLASKTASVNIRSGKSANVPVKFQVQHEVGDIVLQHGKQYIIVSDTVEVAGGIDELFSDDGDGFNFSSQGYALSFGSVGGRSNVPLTIDGPNGEPITFRLTGGGVGTVTIDSEGNIDLTTSGTAFSSVLSAKTKGTTEFLDDVTLNSAIGSVKLGSLDLHGHFIAAAGAKSITLGDLGDPTADADKDISINAFPVTTQKVSLVFGDVHDYSLTSVYMPVAKITAKSWLNDEATTGSNQIFVTALDKLQIAGDLEANVIVSTDAKVTNITVGGVIRDAAIKTQGDIGVLKAAGLSGATILAGLTTVPDVDTVLADFATGRTIGSLLVTGSVADSVIGAAQFNSIVLGSVDGVAGTEGSGIYADAIKSYLRKTPASFKLTNLDTAGTFDASGNYAVRVF